MADVLDQELAGRPINADNPVLRHLANPLGVGGRSVSRLLVDPLGLFGGGEKKPFVYDPDKIYTNPENAERARQIKIKEGTAAVNAAFDDPTRETNRQGFLAAIRKLYTDDANRQKGIADRTRRFSIARGGLTGGSADADSRQMLGEEYTRGLLAAENKAQGAYADLTNQDEQARLNLLSAVRAGMDTTTAASRAGAAISNNVQSAQSNAQMQDLGDLFGNSAKIYEAQQEGAARRRGVLDAYGSLYGANNPYGR